MNKGKIEISLIKSDCEELRHAGKKLPLRSIVCVKNGSLEFATLLAYILSYDTLNLELGRFSCNAEHFQELTRVKERFDELRKILKEGTEKDFIEKMQNDLQQEFSLMAKTLLKDLDLDVWNSAANILQVTIAVYEINGAANKAVYEYKNSDKEIAILIPDSTKYFILNVDRSEERRYKQLKAIKEGIKNLTMALQSPSAAKAPWLLNKLIQTATIFSKQNQQDLSNYKQFLAFNYRSWRYLYNCGEFAREDSGSQDSSCKVVRTTLNCEHTCELTELELSYDMRVMCSECGYIAEDREVEEILREAKMVCVYEGQPVKCIFCRESEDVVKVHKEHYLCSFHLDELRRAREKAEKDVAKEEIDKVEEAEENKKENEENNEEEVEEEKKVDNGKEVVEKEYAKEIKSARKVRLFRCPAKNCRYRFVHTVTEIENEELNKYHQIRLSPLGEFEPEPSE